MVALAFACLGAEAARAEEHLAPNSIFVEGLGAGLAYSINYERVIADKVGIRVGFSYLPIDVEDSENDVDVTLMSFPVTVSFLGIRSGPHVLELGAGASLIHASGSVKTLSLSASGEGFSVMGMALVGYRVHPLGGGFNFRIGAMALGAQGLALSDPDPDTFGVVPWGYLSLGGSF